MFIKYSSRNTVEIKSLISLQVYKGLDIITNKVTAEEQEQCPHHVINFISPLKQNSNIVDFRNKALPIVSFHWYR